MQNKKFTFRPKNSNCKAYAGKRMHQIDEPYAFCRYPTRVKKKKLRAVINEGLKFGPEMAFARWIGVLPSTIDVWQFFLFIIWKSFRFLCNEVKVPTWGFDLIVLVVWKGDIGVATVVDVCPRFQQRKPIRKKNSMWGAWRFGHWTTRYVMPILLLNLLALVGSPGFANSVLTQQFLYSFSLLCNISTVTREFFREGVRLIFGEVLQCLCVGFGFMTSSFAASFIKSLSVCLNHSYCLLNF